MNKLINIKPYVTEKSSAEMESNKYTFLSELTVNKIEIRKYFETQYEVNVLKINVLKRKSKKVKRGKRQGVTKEYLKVILTLKDDSNVDKLKELF